MEIGCHLPTQGPVATRANLERAALASLTARALAAPTVHRPTTPISPRRKRAFWRWPVPELPVILMTSPFLKLPSIFVMPTGSKLVGWIGRKSNVSFLTARIVLRTTAVALPIRTPWPARQPSPKKSPGPRMATTASFPVRDSTDSLTLPS